MAARPSDAAVVEGGWFSANRADLSDPKNETFDSTNRYYSAEYVNGYLLAQSAVTGDLMLVTPTSTYWNASTLVSQNGKKIGDQGVWVLYDMALDYSGQYAETLILTRATPAPIPCLPLVGNMRVTRMATARTTAKTPCSRSGCQNGMLRSLWTRSLPSQERRMAQSC